MAAAGPVPVAMIRAAAKNHAFVNVVVDVQDYAPLLAELPVLRLEQEYRLEVDADALIQNLPVGLQ